MIFIPFYTDTLNQQQRESQQLRKKIQELNRNIGNYQDFVPLNT